MQSYVREIVSAWEKSEERKTKHCIISIRWMPPLEGWVKLNTDGASKGNPGDGGSEGMVQDSTGSWIVGFMFHIGHYTAFTAELRGIHKDLLLV